MEDFQDFEYMKYPICKENLHDAIATTRMLSHALKMPM